MPRCVPFFLFASLLLASNAANTDPLAVHWHPQEHNNWCWAASTEMILEFLTNIDVPQCQQALDEFPTSGCKCPDQVDDCDQPGWPQFEKHKYSSNRTTDCALSWDILRREIDNRRPVAASWHIGDDDTGHMEVITAYATYAGVDYLRVLDPDRKFQGELGYLTYANYVGGGERRHWNDYFAVIPDANAKNTDTGNTFCDGTLGSLAPSQASPTNLEYASSDEESTHLAAEQAVTLLSPFFAKLGMLPLDYRKGGLELDLPFKLFYIRLSDVREKPEATPVVLRGTRQLLYPLRYKNQVLLAITLRKEGDRWPTTSFGFPQSTRMLVDLRNRLAASARVPPREIFKVELAGLNLLLLGFYTSHGLYLAPVDDRSTFGLKPGVPVPAQDIIKAVRPAALRRRPGPS